MNGDPDGDDELRKKSRLAARAARFNNVLPGNRYKELEEARIKERKAFIEQGLITSGKTDLDAAIDLRGTCERMCSEYETEFREYTKEIHPFEAAVAAYSRSDAGAGHGEAAILPSDLRTPAALVPPANPNAVNPPPPTARRALGYTAGFIRDRTRAIRKEFAIQSSWGHEEAIACFERIARWHILCLRELQEETGSNVDMHIDNAELGRAFTSLRQHYNDRREETGLDMPCPNEPEFRAYMLIFDLANKSVSIPTAELPAVILDHPIVQLAWQIRQAAQRNFDSQKEGSKLNSEYGANLITRFIRLLKQPNVPFLLSCLVEVRLREMRRSAIRALTRTYPQLKGDPIRRNEQGEIVERKMILMDMMDSLIGAEEQEDKDTAWDDIIPVSKNPDDESAAVVERFNIEVYRDGAQPVGALINRATRYNDNKDAPFTRRWKLITDKQGSASYADVVNGAGGVSVDGKPAARMVPSSAPSSLRVTAPVYQPKKMHSSTPAAPSIPSAPSSSNAFPSSTGAKSAFGSGQGSAFSSGSAFGPSSAFASGSAFQKAPAPAANGSVFGPKATNGFATATPTPAPEPAPVSKPPPPKEPPSTGGLAVPSFFQKPDTAPPKPPVPSFNFGTPSTPSEPSKAKEPAPAKIPSFFDKPAPPTTTPTPPVSSTPVPSFFKSSAPATVPVTPIKPLSPPKAVTPLGRRRAEPEVDRIKASRQLFRGASSILADELITSVVSALVDKAKPSLEKIVKVQESAKAYQDAKVARRAVIERYADLTLERMLLERVEEVSYSVYHSEQRVRHLTREIAEHWRSWTARMQTLREKAERERLETVKRLRGMGLARSIASYQINTATSSSWSVADIETVPQDQFDMGMELYEAEKTKDQLFASHSFMNSIAKAVTRHLRPTNDDAPIWETVLLSAEHAGTPAAPQARDWLESKFVPPTEVYHRNGIDFTFNVADVHGELPGSSNTGLYVFEAPLDTINSIQRSMNQDDAGDRLDAAAGAVQQRGRYRTALLILTWEYETLDDVIGRLGIQQNIEQFDSVAAVSLEDAEELDDRFAEAVRGLILEDPRKMQVAIPMEGKLVDSAAS
ncbi:hypothetical protein A1Q1_07050 [Trichosporon asahii var. asahii CBS 2479]|uniref:SAC3/GANP/THP3 conserved domain-containing protein n=1 Tax=Trichosporon asahii var. asahii (strain ATCC 90039 / CBS 2479 / JCM 2466 / KCTC 7840 / NBRC 103889/ NCYC 2677 / UAMH 7654) TaxID=1186058 RepID=J5RAX3_TRIAS|nr:hypothetical protein A1Q1_07050 [Trichosporon asahii var. asahii CBS 2479]EJT51638.1 hypothetical protein A1Q1_07050 [Trichosporon asahii var. asahii CBS 2479]